MANQKLESATAQAAARVGNQSSADVVAGDCCAASDCSQGGRDANGCAETESNASGCDANGCAETESNANGCDANGCAETESDSSGCDEGGCPITASEGSGLSHGHHMAWRALLQGHAALVERIGRVVSAAGGVSLDSYDVMLALSKAPGGRLKMGDLACHVVLSRSGLTRLMDRMEAAGLVARELAAGDRRSFEAFLTPAGKAAFAATWPLYARAIAETLAPLSKAEAQQMADWLDRVRLAD